MDVDRSQSRPQNNTIKILELSHEYHNISISTEIPIAEPYNNEIDELSHPDPTLPVYTVKVIFIGDTNIGKTHSLYALQQHKNTSIHTIIGSNQPPTIGVDFASIRRTIESICFKYNIWDTAGQEKYRSITHSFFKNTGIAVLFFDLTNYQSFRSLSGWLRDIHNNCPPSVIIHLVGNKLDLNDKRQVLPDDIDPFVKKHNLQYSEISAHTGESIESILYEPTIALLNMIKLQKIPIKDIVGIKINEFVEVRTGKLSSLCSKCTIM